MDRKPIEVFEFKYSARKLIGRCAVSLCIGIVGLVFGLPLNNRYFSSPLLAGFSFAVMLFGLISFWYPFWKLVLYRRVF